MLNWLFGKPSPRQDFSQAVTGEIVSIRSAQHIEDKGSGFDAEILTVFCDKSGAEISCARFSDDPGFGDVGKGQRVEVSYRQALDEGDFGTPYKATAVRVLSHG